VGVVRVFEDFPHSQFEEAMVSPIE